MRTNFPWALFLSWSFWALLNTAFGCQVHAATDAPSLEEAIKIVRVKARQVAAPLLAEIFHPGRRLLVPKDFSTIQAALDEADVGDQVVVSPGTYYEQLFIRKGVKLTSDAGPQGEQLSPVSKAKLQLPGRSLITIIDGSRAQASSMGMLNFSQESGRQTVVDGFTIRNLPKLNHHIPGHAHAVNLRGASPVITNCLIHDNGSTGIGSHVVFHDHEQPMEKRDFSHENIQYRAAALIFNNILHNNLGRGIGSNHLSQPLILGNEVFENDDIELGEGPGPGIGAKHGAAPFIIGNIIHDNPMGGIRVKKGVAQGSRQINQATHPAICSNVLYDNGTEKPALGISGAGSERKPVRVVGNYFYGSAGATFIGVRKSVAIIANNLFEGSSQGRMAISESTLLEQSAAAHQEALLCQP